MNTKPTKQIVTENLKNRLVSTSSLPVFEQKVTIIRLNEHDTKQRRKQKKIQTKAAYRAHRIRYVPSVLKIIRPCACIRTVATLLRNPEVS